MLRYLPLAGLLFIPLQAQEPALNLESEIIEYVVDPCYRYALFIHEKHRNVRVESFSHLTNDEFLRVMKSVQPGVVQYLIDKSMPGVVELSLPDRKRQYERDLKQCIQVLPDAI